MSVRRQRPVKGRIPRSFGTIPATNRRIEQLAARYNVSKSFVINVVLADQLGIDEQERYDTTSRPYAVVRRRRTA